MAKSAQMDFNHWRSAPEYQAQVPHISSTKFYEITDLLLERPNLNSSHLFRADVLSDSAGKLQTLLQKEQQHTGVQPPFASSDADTVLSESSSQNDNSNCLAPIIPGFILDRTIVRRLIPRKPQVDLPLEQSCFTYIGTSDTEHGVLSVLVVYAPHVQSEQAIPWYHPKVKYLAYQFIETEHGNILSIRYQLFPQTENVEDDRLHRTMLSLLQTFIRLSKHETPAKDVDAGIPALVSARPVHPSALKDTILPQHTVQDTYTRLKQKYAAELIAKWIEKTEPSKHVFEDLAIAAFLIELWKTMYQKDKFPGFVDIACGNGVLVYTLVKEGYHGQGFDARRRKTWKTLEIDQHIQEMLCIPKPLHDTLSEAEIKAAVGDIALHTGIFNPESFIISNHADELTPWTPILSALSHPSQPLPFLSIPCCSHALGGAKHRYTIKDIDHSTTTNTTSPNLTTSQPIHGDLKTLRSEDKSTYACLTKKTVALAEELGYTTEMTLMRIPSTRNIGIVGNRRRVHAGIVEGLVEELVSRECGAAGGVRESALAWLERARKHVEGQGRGKVNLKGRVS